MTNKNQDEVCCQKLDTSLWENKIHEWNNKLFVKDSIPLLFHMPMPWMVGKLITRMWEKIETAGAGPEMKDFVMLAHDPSPWKGEYYMSVTKDVPGVENVKLSGTYFSKVFDGPYHSVPKYIKQMESDLAIQGKKSKKYYFYYSTCPKCAKKFGHNYIVGFAQVG
ncbi:MAG: hypothetical protein JEZ03_05515 [Bacteroidales bacterium]|nr:hypothetical protein [Bacteroidales bacterium]